MNDKRINAGELIRMLKSDPYFSKKQKADNKKIEREDNALKIDQSPLIKELAANGIVVEDVWDLIGRRSQRLEAIPILLKHLREPYLDRNLEGIARALALPEAAYAWAILKIEYEKAPSGSCAKVGLADALSASSNEAVIQELAALAADPKHGESRQLLLDGLRRSPSPLALASLNRLRDDPVLSAEIASWQPKLR